MEGIAAELVSSAFLVLAALFPIVNPLGSTPIFLTLTYGLDEAARVRLAQRIALNGLILILVSIFIGTHILSFFGISLPVVQIGGGLLVASAGWGMLRRSDDDSQSESRAKGCNPSNYMQQAFYPLTLPLTVGPGSIAAAITVGANRIEGSQWHPPRILGMLLGAIGIAIAIYACYRSAEKIAKALGASAMNVVLRLSSFILICIGVQIIWNGVSALLRSVLEK